MRIVDKNIFLAKLSDVKHLQTSLFLQFQLRRFRLIIIGVFLQENVAMILFDGAGVGVVIMKRGYVSERSLV